MDGNEDMDIQSTPYVLNTDELDRDQSNHRTSISSSSSSSLLETVIGSTSNGGMKRNRKGNGKIRGCGNRLHGIRGSMDININMGQYQSVLVDDEQTYCDHVIHDMKQDMVKDMDECGMKTRSNEMESSPMSVSMMGMGDDSVSNLPNPDTRKMDTNTVDMGTTTTHKVPTTPPSSTMTSTDVEISSTLDVCMGAVVAVAAEAVDMPRLGVMDTGHSIHDGISLSPSTNILGTTQHHNHDTDTNTMNNTSGVRIPSTGTIQTEFRLLTIQLELQRIRYQQRLLMYLVDMIGMRDTRTDTMYREYDGNTDHLGNTMIRGVKRPYIGLDDNLEMGDHDMNRIRKHACTCSIALPNISSTYPRNMTIQLSYLYMYVDHVTNGMDTQNSDCDTETRDRWKGFNDDVYVEPMNNESTNTWISRIYRSIYTSRHHHYDTDTILKTNLTRHVIARYTDIPVRNEMGDDKMSCECVPVMDITGISTTRFPRFHAMFDASMQYRSSIPCVRYPVTPDTRFYRVRVWVDMGDVLKRGIGCDDVKTLLVFRIEGDGDGECGDMCVRCTTTVYSFGQRILEMKEMQRVGAHDTRDDQNNEMKTVSKQDDMDKNDTIMDTMIQTSPNTIPSHSNTKQSTKTQQKQKTLHHHQFDFIKQFFSVFVTGLSHLISPDEIRLAITNLSVMQTLDIVSVTQLSVGEETGLVMGHVRTCTVIAYEFECGDSRVDVTQIRDFGIDS